MTRRVALESVALLLLVSLLIFLGSRTRSEATATLATVEQSQPSEIPTPPAAAKRLLSIAVRHAYEPPLLDENLTRVFRVDVLRNRDLMLVCKAENDALAVEICGRTVKEAAATGLFLGLERAHETTPIGRRVFDAAWPALLAAFGWFLVRTSFKPRSGGEVLAPPEPAGEWQSWSMPRRAAANDALLPGATAAASGARRPPIVNTVVGMPALRPAGSPLMASELGLSARRSPLDTRTTARMLRVAPKETRTRSAAPPTSTTPPQERERRRISTTPDLSRRVLYHVSGVPWNADPKIVDDDVLEQLASLRDEVGRSADTRGCVIRVTSSSNSKSAKTQVATQLAWLLPREGSRVLLMEADLDAPALHKALRVNVPRGFGASEQLERMRDEGDDGAAAPTVIRITPALHVLVEGRSGTPALFDSPQFSAALAHLRAEHPVIVIDGPVVDTWPDSQSLRSVADIVVFVVAASTALSEAIAMSNRHFEHHPMLRVVKTGG